MAAARRYAWLVFVLFCVLVFLFGVFPGLAVFFVVHGFAFFVVDFVFAALAIAALLLARPDASAANRR